MTNLFRYLTLTKYKQCHRRAAPPTNGQTEIRAAPPRLLCLGLRWVSFAFPQKHNHKRVLHDRLLNFTTGRPKYSAAKLRSEIRENEAKESRLLKEKKEAKSKEEKELIRKELAAVRNNLCYQRKRLPERERPNMSNDNDNAMNIDVSASVFLLCTKYQPFFSHTSFLP